MVGDHMGIPRAVFFAFFSCFVLFCLLSTVCCSTDYLLYFLHLPLVTFFLFHHQAPGQVGL
jgi:hypothetical protein